MNNLNRIPSTQEQSSEIVSIVNGESLTTSLLIAEGVGNPHSSVIRLIKDNQPDFEEFGLVGFQIRARSEGQHGGGDTEYALLNEQQATLLMTYMRNSPVVKQFKKALVKAFYEMRDNSHGVPTSFHEALLLAANIEKEKALAIGQRDEAIRTKAHISDKKTATAMATASTQKRRAEKYAKELGCHTNWKAARSIPWASKVLSPSKSMWSQLGKYLKRLSDEMGCQCNEIEDSTYGSIKAYHIDVINEAQNRLLADRTILAKYRKVRALGQ